MLNEVKSRFLSGKNIFTISILTIVLTTLLNAQGITNTLGGNKSTDKFIVENKNSEAGLVVTGEGNVGIGTNSPVANLHVSGDDGLLVQGTFANGVTKNLGAGTRLHFYPKKAAFRAGYVDGTQWDDANIGDYSTAMGDKTTASGIASTAMGVSTTASGYASTAMGQSTTVSGQSSTAMGYATTASGWYSTAMGYATTASGNASTAMGDKTTASGIASTAMGYMTTASGKRSTAMGREIEASGNYTVAIALNDQNGTNVTQANTMAIMGGKVGIGIINPSFILDVKGNANFDGKIYQRGGLLHADYVFEDDYKLETIEEHAEFMWTEKHLKAIPKAQIDENGNEIVEVGSHRKGIVEELEKAHIYISQLEERLSKLESKLDVD